MQNRILSGIIPRCGHKRRGVHGRFTGAAGDHLSASRQYDPEDRSALRRTFHNNFAAVILNDFLHDRES